MKTKFYLIIAFLIILLTGNGCRDYSTKTKINSDGSCERTVVVSGDSSDVAGVAALPFPIPIDSTWRIERKKDPESKDKFLYTAVKKFDDVNILNREYQKAGKIGVSIKFEKKFRWFYTYYNYEETYKAYFPFRIIPLKSFLTPKEYEMYLDDDTTKAFKKRLDEYAAANYMEYFYQIIISAVENHKLKDLNRELILSKKKYIGENIDKKTTDKISLLNFLEKTFGTKSVWEIRPEIEKAYDDIMTTFDFKADGSYENQVSMPGIILSTNSKSITGNSVVWKVDSKRFCFEDFTMQVESRLLNTWTFIASGIIILGIIILLLVPKFRKK
jgi:hypothetical protein